MSNIQFKTSREILKASKKYEGEDKQNLEDIAILISAKDFPNAKREADRLDTMLREECYEPRLSDELNPEYLFSCTYTELLCRIAKGEIDIQALAMKQLRNRGLNIDGVWVGFGK